MVYPTEVVKQLANADSERALVGERSLFESKSKPPFTLRAVCGDDSVQ
jgi:hypothetical protein